MAASTSATDKQTHDYSPQTKFQQPWRLVPLRLGISPAALLNWKVSTALAASTSATMVPPANSWCVLPFQQPWRLVPLRQGIERGSFSDDPEVSTALAASTSATRFQSEVSIDGHLRFQQPWRLVPLRPKSQGQAGIRTLGFNSLGG